MKHSPEFDEILSNFDPEVQQLAKSVRKLIFDVLPQTVEVPWVQQKVIGYGTGPKKMTEHFCWIQPNKAYVNLGFNYGAELPDADKLLEGTGKLFRHVKIKSASDVKRPGVRKLLEVACKHRVPAPRS
jgi:hypothetical protein